MLITGHMRQIVQACYPETREEAMELWHNIKPVRFGNEVPWQQVGPFETLATYQIPDNAAYLAILKTECYTVTNTAAAPGFRNFEPSPEGTGRWAVNKGGALSVPITQTVPIYLLAEASEFLVVKSGQAVLLEVTLSPPPDANPRLIRTTVYSYQISAIIADRIGGGEVFITTS